MNTLFRKVKEHSSSKKYTYGKVYLPKEYIGEMIEIRVIKKEVEKRCSKRKK